MKHPDHDISVYIHSDICRDSGYCTCPSGEDISITGRVVSCRIRGLIGNSWHYRIFINLTRYEIVRLADYERFYTLVVSFNRQHIEERCIDRRDSSTIFVLRPDHNSNPKYIEQAFPEMEMCNGADRTALFAGPCNWLIEIKVFYRQVVVGRLYLLRRSSAQGSSSPMSPEYGALPESLMSESDEELLIHFKFIGGPIAMLEQLEVPKPRPRSLQEPPTVNIGYPYETVPSDELPEAPSDDVNLYWDSPPLDPRQRTIRVQHSNAGLEAVSRFAVDRDSILIINEDPEDTSLLISTGTPVMHRPQPRWDLAKFAERWEEPSGGLKPRDQSLKWGENNNTGALHLGPILRPGIEFGQTCRRGQILDDITLEAVENTDPLSITRRIRDLRARFDQGLDLFKERGRYPWEKDRA